MNDTLLNTVRELVDGKYLNSVTCKLCDTLIVDDEECLTAANEAAYEHLAAVHKLVPVFSPVS